MCYTHNSHTHNRSKIWMALPLTQVRVQLKELRVAGLGQVLSDHLLQACMITNDVLQCGDLRWNGVEWF